VYLPNLGKIVFPSRENSRVKIGNPKILEKNSPKIGGGGQVPQFLEVKLSHWPYIAPYRNSPLITLGGGDMGVESLNFGPDFLKIGGSPPQNLTFWKALGEGYKP